jgi:hypothetical protein
MPGRVSLENRTTMNVEDPAIMPIDSDSASSGKEMQSKPVETRVEQCEFESLLRRAMEILDSRSRGISRRSP